MAIVSAAAQREKQRVFCINEQSAVEQNIFNNNRIANIQE